MKLYDELFFEITLEGSKADLKRCVRFLTSGELDEFFEVSSDYVSFDDDYADAADGDKCSLVFSNDDLGVEIDRFDPEEFLDVFCKATKALDVVGRFYDLDDEEYAFNSPQGDDGFSKGTLSETVHDELDDEAFKDDLADEEDEDGAL